mgnify:CR=1 FL=1
MQLALGGLAVAQAHVGLFDAVVDRVAQEVHQRIGHLLEQGAIQLDLAALVDELRQMFAAAKARGLLDRDALEASLARVEWRPSLALVRTMMAEFCD